MSQTHDLIKLSEQLYERAPKMTDDEFNEFLTQVREGLRPAFRAEYRYSKHIRGFGKISEYFVQSAIRARDPKLTTRLVGYAQLALSSLATGLYAPFFVFDVWIAGIRKDLKEQEVAINKQSYN